MIQGSRTSIAKGIKAWFGDPGDGVHNGGPDDPRMALIEAKSNYISYRKHTVCSLGFMKEVGMATLTVRSRIRACGDS